MTEQIGRMAGGLLGAAGVPGSATIDAVVAATALTAPGPVVLLTSDPTDLTRLTRSRADLEVVAG